MGLYLITGGQGFIGKHLTDELTSAGHDVRVIDSLVEQAHGGKTTSAKNGGARSNGHRHAVDATHRAPGDRRLVDERLWRGSRLHQ